VLGNATRLYGSVRFKAPTPTLSALGPPAGHRALVGALFDDVTAVLRAVRALETRGLPLGQVSIALPAVEDLAPLGHAENRAESLDARFPNLETFYLENVGTLRGARGIYARGCCFFRIGFAAGTRVGAGAGFHAYRRCLVGKTFGSFERGGVELAAYGFQ
jgi:hypothetical protein